MKKVVKKRFQKPDWLKVKLPSGNNFFKLKKDLEKRKLSTICQSAKCPNIGECWERKHATFLIMGQVCSRNCNFCSVTNGVPEDLNPAEAGEILEMVEIMDLKYVVITSVTRDDLADGGSKHFTEIINRLKKNIPDLIIEVLIPDFKGNLRHLDHILSARPDVLSHNIEIVKRLYPAVNRNPKNYNLSLDILKYGRKKGALTKSSLMVGLGETIEEIEDVFHDLRENGVSLLTIGQYLQPTVKNSEVKKYYNPSEFADLKKKALAAGFTGVESGPFVRSSYHADKLYKSGQSRFKGRPSNG